MRTENDSVRARCRVAAVATFAGAVLGVLAGCTVGPDYAAPKPKLAPAYTAVNGAARSAALSHPSSEAADLAAWWTVFRDPELEALITRASERNLDLKLALASVREARAQRAAIAGGLGPEIDLSAGYNRGRGSENVVLPLGGGGSGGGGASRAEAQVKSGGGGLPGSAGSAFNGGGASGGPTSPFGEGGLPGVTTNLYQAGFDASWEIDIFGGTRRALEAANAGVAAAVESGRDARVSLLAEVATVYLELRQTQERLRIAQDNLTAQREALDVIHARAATGFTIDLDVAQQEAQVATTEATIPTLELAATMDEHTLALMLDLDADALEKELAPKPEAAAIVLPAEVPVGVPSELLRRRPDVRRAERELAQATAEIGVDTAALFPRFSLTGMVGFDSSDLHHLGDGSSRYYSIAPGLRWPILDWGRIRATVRADTERREQAFLHYRKAVAQALKDVEDALVRYRRDQERRAALARAVSASRRARDLARDRFAHGVSDVLATIETQRALLQAEDARAQSAGAVRRDLVALYKALGGGWGEPRESTSGK